MWKFFDVFRGQGSCLKVIIFLFCNYFFTASVFHTEKRPFIKNVASSFLWWTTKQDSWSINTTGRHNKSLVDRHRGRLQDRITETKDDLTSTSIVHSTNSKPRISKPIFKLCRRIVINTSPPPHFINYINNCHNKYWWSQKIISKKPCHRHMA